MTMKKFIVELCANLPKCDMPGYQQSLKVYDPEDAEIDPHYGQLGKWMGEWIDAPYNPGEAPRDVFWWRQVLAVEVRAADVWGAFKAFRRWERGQESSARRIA